MSAAPTIPFPPGYGAPPDRGVRRFSVDEYHQMIRAGFFAHNERFELLEGFIVPKMPRDPIHDATIEIMMELLLRVLPPGWRVRPQLAVTLDDSEPEPDLAIVHGDPRSRMTRHPGPSDAALVIEVANTTLRDDREIKGRIYARSSIAEYWIINLIERRLERYRQPSGDVAIPGYADRADLAAGDRLTLSLPGSEAIELEVSSMLP